MATQTPTRTLVNGARGARSTVALKLSMAVSGLVFIGFVLMHMYGNLKAFWGEEAFNGYALHLREIGQPMLPHEGLLWILRAVLIVAVLVHVLSAKTLWKRANQARRVSYEVKRNNGSSFSSRTMRWGGITILLFVIWHLANFTIGKVNITGGETNNPYHLMVDTFGVWWMTIIYLLAMVALALHLHHGTWSALQTLGLTNTAKARVHAKRTGIAVAVIIAGGFSLVPLAVLTGIIS